MNAAHPHETRRIVTWVILLFFLAAGLRLGWVGWRYGRAAAWQHLQYPDEDAYVLSARSLAAGNGLVDEFGFRATYMPAYPAFLALFVGHPHGLLWARVIQAILAAWVAPGTFLLAREFLRQCTPTSLNRNGAPAIALLAGFLAAFDPFLVFFSGLLLTEALYAAVLVAAWLPVLQLVNPNRRRNWLGSVATGGMLALAVLLRPAGMTLAVSAMLLIVACRRFDRAGWLSAGATLAVLLACLAPWAIRNGHVIGEYRWLTTRGGISLYDGVQPGGSGESNLAHTKTMPQAVGLSETQWDAFFAREARREIREHPGRIAGLAVTKLLRTWRPWPNVAEYRSGMAGLISTAWMSLVLCTAAVGWWQCRRAVGAWLILLAPVMLTTLLHMLFVASVRYRVPVMPMVMVLSAAGVGAIMKVHRARRGSPIERN